MKPKPVVGMQLLVCMRDSVLHPGSSISVCLGTCISVDESGNFEVRFECGQLAYVVQFNHLWHSMSTRKSAIFTVAPEYMKISLEMDIGEPTVWDCSMS